MRIRKEIALGALLVLVVALLAVQLGFLVRLDSALRRHEKESATRHFGFPAFLEQDRGNWKKEFFSDWVTNSRAEALALEGAMVLRTPILQRLGADRATLVWESPAAAPTEVSYAGPDGAARRVEIPGSRVRHEVDLTGLAPATRYRGVAAPASPFEFETYPAAIERVRLAVIGDTQGGSQIDRWAAVIRRYRPHALLHCGDLVSNGNFYSHWREGFFLPNVVRLLGEVPIYPVLGNHELDSPYYFAFFSLPGNERWYSFDIGPARFFALDTNLDLLAGGEQFDWLAAELAAARDVRWRIVFFHHPPYPARLENEEHSRQGLIVKASLVPLFQAHKVALAMAGHVHAYYRSVPIHGTTYLITGGGGGGLGAPAPDPEFTAVTESRFHFTYLEITEESIEGKAISMSDETLDQFRIEWAP